MAYRLMNNGKHPLRVDLRGEAGLYLEPGAVSRPLREEQLYHNPYLQEWERAGVVTRLPASMKDVLTDEDARAKGRADAAVVKASDAAAHAAPAAAAAKKQASPAHDDKKKKK